MAPDSLVADSLERFHYRVAERRASVCSFNTIFKSQKRDLPCARRCVEFFRFPFDRRCIILRIVPIASAGHAETYYAKTDGGYYLDESGLRTEWVGLGAAMLGLSGTPEYEEFRRLIHGLHPETGDHYLFARG